MSDAPPRTAPKPPPEDSGRGFALFGAGLLGLAGLIYVPGGLLAGATLGGGFHLDPTWPWPLPYVGNGFAALAFVGGGLVVALLCAAAAGLTVARSPYAPWACAAAGVVLLATANLPLAVVAFSLAGAAAPAGQAPGAPPKTA